MKIKVGQIWEVTTGRFLTSGRNNKYHRPIVIGKGEKIEIRYPYEWHFRAEDNSYFHASEIMIFENCKLIGIITESVRFRNKATLEEIIRLDLYKKVK